MVVGFGACDGSLLLGNFGACDGLLGVMHVGAWDGLVMVVHVVDQMHVGADLLNDIGAL